MNNIDADIYCFQESFHPLSYLEYPEFNKLRGQFILIPSVSGWGNTIISKKYKLKNIKLETKFKGRLTGAAFKIGTGERFRIFNLHVPIKGNYSRYNLEEMLDLISRFIRKGNTIVVGDFNFGEYFDKTQPQYKNKEFFDYLLEQSLTINTYKLFHNEEAQTFRPPRSPENPVHIDYIFVSRDLRDQVKSCEVLVPGDASKLSDHNPVIAEIDI